ncbi:MULTISPECIES: helix-turn-helix domain-containing protein [Pseudomonas]|nr:helix-turn-helix transcriptional regulator [Pseudomonas nitroreducens]
MDEEGHLSTTDMSIGENIRKLRELKGLSQKKAAEMCGIAESTWAKYEKGETMPTASPIRLMAKGLQVSTDEILLEDDERSIRQDLRRMMQKIEEFPEPRQQEIKRALKGHLMVIEQEEWDEQ